MATGKSPYCKGEPIKKLASPSGSEREKGYVLVILAILIGLLISFAGLALDTGRLYQTKSRLERAARAAAVAAVGYRARMGWFYIYGGPSATGPLWNAGTGARITDLNLVSGSRVKMLKMRAYKTLVENLSLAGLNPATMVSPSASCTVGSPLGPSFDDSDWSDVSTCTFSGINYDPETDEVTVDVTYDAPTFLAGRVPVLSIAASCYGGTCPMSFRSRAALQPAAISFIPDVSGSMRCSATADPATCTPATSPNRKIDRLVDAAKAFYKMFNPWHDYIAVVPFNLVAAPITPSTGPNPILSADATATFGATKQRWELFSELLTSQVPPPRPGAGLLPMSNTNHCDALWEARTRFNADLPTGAVPSGLKFYVFFTDGAPTAGRFDFVRLDTAKRDAAFAAFTTNTYTFAGAGGNDDYFMYSIEWRDAAGNTYTGPSPLIHNTLGGPGYPNARARLFNYEIGSNSGQVYPQTGSEPDVIPITPSGYWPFPTPGNASPYSDKTKFKEILEDALDKNSNLGFVMPGEAKTLPFTPRNYNSLDIRLNDPDPIPIGGNAPYYQQLFYHCTLEAAQIIRTENGESSTIFAVGLGAALPPSAYTDMTPGSTIGDAYGDHANQWARKDMYFRMVAHDFERTGDFSFNASPNRNANQIRINQTYNDLLGVPQANPHSHRFNVGGVGTNISFKVGIERAADLDSGSSGRYFATNNANDLTDIFVQIATEVLSKVGA